MQRLLRAVLYVWAAPASAVGLIVTLALLACGASIAVVDGVVEVAGGTRVARWLGRHPRLAGFKAITLGHVVIARDGWSLESTRAHERVHVRQCEAWGPFFVPAYLAASLSAFLRGRNFYFDNRFEVEAFHAARIQAVSEEQSHEAGVRYPLRK